MKELIHDIIHALLMMFVAWSKRSEVIEQAHKYHTKFRRYRTEHKNSKPVRIRLK